MVLVPIVGLNGVPMYPGGTMFTAASERVTPLSETPPSSEDPLDPLVVPLLPLLLPAPLLLAVPPLLLAVTPLLPAPLVDPELVPPSGWEEPLLDVPQFASTIADVAMARARPTGRSGRLVDEVIIGNEEGR